MADVTYDVTYNVAVSLDGFISPTNGSSDWIVPDDSVNFQALYSRFDMFIMGRKTYDAVVASGMNDLMMQGSASNRVYVLSRTLEPKEHPGITIIRDERYLDLIRAESMKNSCSVWIMGGGWLAAQCLNAGLLTSIEVAIMPVVLGNGTKLLNGLDDTNSLQLKTVQCLQQSGIIMASYSVKHGA